LVLGIQTQVHKR